MDILGISDNKSIALLDFLGSSIINELIEFKELKRKCGFSWAHKWSNSACLARRDNLAFVLINMNLTFVILVEEEC